jgi:predicted transcriptional regulator
MNKNTKSKVLGVFQDYSSVDSQLLAEIFNRRKVAGKFDNSVMRYVRRLKEGGYVKKLGRGQYTLTAKGRRLSDKTLYQ